MPAICAHYIFARKMIPEIQKENIVFKLNTAAVYWGTQGPDFLFYGRRLPWMIGSSTHRLGSALHKIDPDLTFNAIREYISNITENRDVALSYALGMLCHYALDRKAHPYVNYMTDQIVRLEKFKFKKGIIHNQIETNLDTVMLKKYMKMDGNAFEAKNCLPVDHGTYGVISGMMSYVIKKTLGKKIRPRKVRRALKDTRKIHGYLTDKKGRKKKLFLRIEKMGGQGPGLSVLIRERFPDKQWDYANINYMGWTDGQDRTVHGSFFELFLQALDDAKILIWDFSEALKDGRPMRTVTGGISFETGKVIPVSQTSNF